MSEETLSATIAALVSLVIAALGFIVTMVTAERKLRRDFRLEFSAEAAIERLLAHPKWELRSFDVIKHHVAGFSDDALRQILVRAGAIRFTSQDGDERWGLLRRNESRLSGAKHKS